jgi:hypothetical protein
MSCVSASLFQVCERERDRAVCPLHCSRCVCEIEKRERVLRASFAVPGVC